MLFRGKTLKQAISKATAKYSSRQKTNSQQVSNSEWNAAIQDCENLRQRMSRVAQSAQELTNTMQRMERDMARLSREQLEILGVLGLNILTVRAWRHSLRNAIDRIRNRRLGQSSNSGQTNDALDRASGEVRRVYLAMSTLALWDAGLELSREMRQIKDRYYPLVRNLDGLVEHFEGLSQEFQNGRCRWVLLLAEAANQPLIRR